MSLLLNISAPPTFVTAFIVPVNVHNVVFVVSTLWLNTRRRKKILRLIILSRIVTVVTTADESNTIGAANFWYQNVTWEAGTRDENNGF
jgi:hypothetical protein